MLSSSSINTTTTTCNRNNLNHQTPTTNNTTNNKAMEDVWDGIKLTSLSGHNSDTTPTSKGANFQDFLARPFNSFTVDTSPVTALTLSTCSEYPPRQKDLQLVHNASKTEPFAHPFSNKRAPPSRDMRDARLMKNRESAARSRARKQENIASSSTLSFRVSPLFRVFVFICITMIFVRVLLFLCRLTCLSWSKKSSSCEKRMQDSENSSNWFPYFPYLFDYWSFRTHLFPFSSFVL